MPAFGAARLQAFVFLRRFIYVAVGAGAHPISSDAVNFRLKLIGGGGRGGIVPGGTVAGVVQIGGGGAAGAYVEQWEPIATFDGVSINFEIGGYATGGGGAGSPTRLKNAAAAWIATAGGGLAGQDSPGSLPTQYSNGGYGSDNTSAGDWIVDGEPGHPGIASTGRAPAIGYGGRNFYGSVAYGRGGDGYYQLDGGATVPGAQGSHGAFVVEEYT